MVGVVVGEGVGELDTGIRVTEGGKLSPVELVLAGDGLRVGEGDSGIEVDLSGDGEGECDVGKTVGVSGDWVGVLVGSALTTVGVASIKKPHPAEARQIRIESKIRTIPPLK